MKRPTATTCAFCQSAAVKPLSVSIEAMCEMVGCRRSLAFDLIRRGEVEAAKLGRRTVVLVSSIEAMLERNKIKWKPASTADGAETSRAPTSCHPEVCRSHHAPRRTGATARQP